VLPVGAEASRHPGQLQPIPRAVARWPAYRGRAGAAHQARIRLGSAGVPGQRRALGTDPPWARVRHLFGQRHRRALCHGPALGRCRWRSARPRQLAQGAGAGVHQRHRGRGVRSRPQQFHRRAGWPHRPAGLPRTQLHADRGRPALEPRPPHLRPAAAVGCGRHARVRASAARSGNPGSGRMSTLRVAIALMVWLLALPACAQDVRPNNDDMMESPPVAAPREGYWADVLAHDPVLIRDGDTWYAFVTGPGITVYSSKNLETWKAEPQVFARIPAWAYDIVPGFNGHIWAPDISHHDGTYYVYYSISSGGKNTSAI